MITLFSRRAMLPLIVIFCLLFVSNNIRKIPLHSSVQFYKFVSQVPIPLKTNNESPIHLALPKSSHGGNTDPTTQNSQIPLKKIPSALLEFTACSLSPNRYTNHIRLPNLLYNISMSPKSGEAFDNRTFWNPTILALPYWAKNQYLLISMVTPDADPYRRNVMCEANICYPKSQKPKTTRERTCSDEDLAFLGRNGGLRCVNPPVELNVPPTPAAKCDGEAQVFSDIPGFHDPRIFYTGRGEPILMMSSQSQYACIGLWVLDLRALYPQLNNLFSSSPKRLGPGPVISYPTLTELTKNPSSARQPYEKNWVIFSTSPSTSYIQYEVNSSSRTIAKLIGGGLTTTNITSPLEQSCLLPPTASELESGKYKESAKWHQTTPSLKLILCTRGNKTCHNQPENAVFIALIQRKNLNAWNLPTRYERFVVVWSADPPFNMLAMSKYPLLMSNETTSGWTAEETWDDVPEGGKDGNGEMYGEEREHWGVFTYTTSIAWAWGREEGDIREKGTGFLDDEVVLSVGVDDVGMVFAKVLVSESLVCLRVCPGAD
ncbi:hypothetical protein HYALB_00007907 [Hymenoscyphus albidus]|uniref:Uncharacterized protein n=1 Tax=Hymenoscyphus albidus TaxID=595503 RepID=A0A9N9LMZ0_9HELO|nr:hypothetical protein HYALB_00007907 [Hymenoscyphus albidus]